MHVSLFRLCGVCLGLLCDLLHCVDVLERFCNGLVLPCEFGFELLDDGLLVEQVAVGLIHWVLLSGGIATILIVRVCVWIASVVICRFLKCFTWNTCKAQALLARLTNGFRCDIVCSEVIGECVIDLACVSVRSPRSRPSCAQWVT